MILPDVARKMSSENENPTVKRIIESTEKGIISAASEGLHSTVIGYTDNKYAREAAEYFKCYGYTVVINSVRQRSAYYVRW